MPNGKRKATDDLSDDDNNNSDKNNKRLRISGRQLTIKSAVVQNDNQDTFHFDIIAATYEKTGFGGGTGPVLLKSNDKSAGELFRQLRQVDPAKDADEYKDLTQSDSFPTDLKGRPILIDEDNDSIYFDPARFYYDVKDMTALYLDPVSFDETKERRVYVVGGSGMLVSVSVPFKKEGGGGFGAARSDTPGDYLWFGNRALGYALGLDCADTHYLGAADKVKTLAQANGKVAFGKIVHNGKTYYRTNTPENVTTANARNAATAPQESEIIYYKTCAQRTPDSTFRRAPAVPSVPRIPDRSVRMLMDTSSSTNAQTTSPQSTNTQTTNTQTTNTQTTSTQTTIAQTNPPTTTSQTTNANTGTSSTSTNTSSSSGNTQTATTGSNNSNNNSPPPKPSKPSDLFDQSVYKGGYKSYTKGASNYPTTKTIADYKQEFRKKALSMPLQYSSGKRDDTATAVYQAVKPLYQPCIDKYVPGRHLPATAYCGFMMETFTEVKEALHKLSANNPAVSTNNANTNTSSSSSNNNNVGIATPPAGIATDQEWCHLYGHAAGGHDDFYNFVSGSHYANTEQLAIEMAQRRGRYPNLKLSVTAYRLLDTEIVLWIRYKIFHQDVKIFDHVFDGQSEGFNYHEFKILETTVQRVIAQAVSAVKGYEKAASDYANKINSKIAARHNSEKKATDNNDTDQSDTQKPPPYDYKLPASSSTNSDTNSNTTSNAPQLTNNNNNNTSQLTG